MTIGPFEIFIPEPMGFSYDVCPLGCKILCLYFIGFTYLTKECRNQGYETDY